MNNKLDEMQEQKLLQVEHVGVWLAFWGLLLVILVQLVWGSGLLELAGEWCVFMVLSIYLVVGCMKNGIWDRKIPANRKANLWTSLIAAILVGIVTAAVFLVRFHDPERRIFVVVIGVLAAMALTFAATFALLSLFLRIFRRRVVKLENTDPAEPEQE